ncbi:MAG: DUF434 domain-containing protein [Chitinophagales bacterium]
MPNKQKHRGQHPNDQKLFAPKFTPILQAATSDLSWLLSKGYAEKAALKLVGDRFKLTERQRKAIQGAACSDASQKSRQEKHCSIETLKDSHVFIDGFNLLITIESALSGGFIFKGQDGSRRDLASVHGTYKRVSETIEAIELVGQTLKELKVEKATWYFDKPVSNSGRLKTLIYEVIEGKGLDWDVQLVYNPDKELIVSPSIDNIVVSADSMVLEGAKKWFNLGAYIMDKHINLLNLIDLSCSPQT